MGEQLLIAICSLLFFPVVCVVTLVIVLATSGKSFGIREAYVGILLKIFEACKVKVQVKKRSDDDDSDSDEENGEKQANGYKQDEKLDNDDQIIEKDFTMSATKGLERPDWMHYKKEFELSDIFYFSKCGMEAIIDDNVTKRFSAEELPSWNLLTRTQKPHQFMSVRLTALWCVGCFVRYVILLPFRVVIAFIWIIWLVVSTAFIGYLKDSSFKLKVYRWASLMCFRILCRAFSGVIRYHNRENMAKNGICVANHTSPVDVIILSCDNTYALANLRSVVCRCFLNGQQLILPEEINVNRFAAKPLATDLEHSMLGLLACTNNPYATDTNWGSVKIGQAHGGLLGLMQRSLGRATSHIWFERSEAKDRCLVAKRLKSHIEDENKLPVLIFPEGTCINNTSVMMFKKGSFEVASTIYPVAIKYDPRFGDAFWNSAKHNWTQHLLQIMTSWALVCDVWYLPPMTRMEGEDAVSFANRVKSEIASQGGLVDLEWDGELKRCTVKDSMKEVPQEQYSKILKVD